MRTQPSGILLARPVPAHPTANSSRSAILQPDMDAELVNEVRLQVLRTTIDTMTVPSAPETAAVLGISSEQGVEAYRQLGDGHVYVLEPGDATRLRMANPFSAVPTAFRAEAGRKSYYGNCVWDALGVVSLMGGNGQVKTCCPDCGETLTLVTLGHELVQKEGVVHFSVPAAHWWDDIIYT